MPEVKELVQLHNLHMYHVMIQSELKNLIAANAVGTAKLELWSGSATDKNPGLIVRSG